MNTQQQQNTSVSSQQKHIVLREETSLDGKPLDFSFRQIKSLDELRTLEPRSGKRKEPPKEEEDNKEEAKKIESEEDEESKQNDNDAQSQKDDEGEKQENQEGGQKQAKEKKEEKKPENKQPQVIRVIPSSQANAIIANNQMQVGGGAKTGGVKGYDENKGNSQKYVVKINLVCSSLILSYNKIRSIANFRQNIDFVMFDDWKSNLCWIDLSHNYLENLDYGFQDVPNLKSLYLHCNFLSDLSELIQLQELPLRTLTIHGNPVETINNFRLYIIGILPSLKRLDSVVVSKKERDNCVVWLNTFKNKLPPPCKDAAKPPQENQTQNTKQQ